MKLIESIKSQWTSELSKFPKQLRNLCIIVSSMCTAGLGVAAMYSSLTNYITILAKVLFFSTIIATALQFTSKKTVNDSNKDGK
jgi:uncharacterized membrane protein